MSRRSIPTNGVTRMSPAAARAARERGDKPVYVPADRCVRVSIVDPAGHRHLVVGRYYDEPDPQKTGWFTETLSMNVLLHVDVDDDNEDLWTRAWFTCKACRDQGIPYETFIDWSDVIGAVAELWQKGAPDDSPVKGRIRTRA